MACFVEDNFVIVTPCPQSRLDLRKDSRQPRSSSNVSGFETTTQSHGDTRYRAKSILPRGINYISEGETEGLVKTWRERYYRPRPFIPVNL